MRILLGGIIFLSVCLVGISAQAHDSWVLYDNFNSEFMDIGKWGASQRIDTGVVILEYVRELHGGRLHMMGRAFGRVVGTPALGNAAGDINANFSMGNSFTSLKLSVKVNDVEVTGCPDVNTTPSSSRARLVGFFFNATKAVPTPGDRTDDVLVQIRIQRNSDSTDKPQILEVWADVIRCTNSDCSTASPDGNPAVLLGNVKLGQWATIEVDWDGNKQFNFKLNKERPIVYNILYGGWNVDPVSSPVGTLGVSHRIANCPSNERAMGFIDAEFDNLFFRK
jgi:hypothetical protein